VRPTIALLLLFTLVMVTAGAPERVIGGGGAEIGLATCEIPQAQGTPIKGTAGIVVVDGGNVDVTFFTVVEDTRLEFRALVLGVEFFSNMQIVCDLLNFGTGADGTGPTLNDQVLDELGFAPGEKVIRITKRGILGFRCPGEEGCTGDEVPRNPRRGINFDVIPGSEILSLSGLPHSSALANVTLHIVDP
jgi:hypothetical protein